MPTVQELILELENEARATTRLLERVPEDKLTWQPHAKSMSIGQLALHIASIPGRISQLLLLDGMDGKQAKFQNPQPTTRAEILSALENGLAGAKEVLHSINNEKATQPWKLSNGDREVFSAPRTTIARNLMLNHWYHHRGQLTVYLRLLDVPLPVTYGRSADENPFA